MRLFILFAVVLLAQIAGAQQDEYSDQFPDAPEPVKAMPFGGYEHDKTWDPPPQKTFTNRFIIASVALAASIPFDVEMTQRCIAKGTCVEGNGVDGLRPSRGEMYKNDLIPAAAVWGFSVLVQSRHFPKVMGWVAYIPMLYGTTLHVKGGLEGLRH